jgi:hypothetical protein
MLLDNNVLVFIMGNSKVSQPEVWYLVLAGNEYDEVEMVDGYVGITVRKLGKRKHRSRDLTPSQQWL